MSKMQDIQDWLRKYLFWCLCGAIAIFSLAAWWFGVGTLAAKTKANLADIEKNFGIPNEVTQRVVPAGGFHPNDKTNSDLSTRTLKTRETVLKAWKELVEQHKPIYKWPELLDKNFQEWIKANPWETEIPFDQLDEYQNKVLKELERIVTKVAKADWPDAVAAAAAASGTGTTFGGTTRGGEEATHGGGAAAGTGIAGLTGIPGVSEKLLWDPTDIQLFKNRYKWPLRPSTADVRLAQEDLWVLEQLCRIIAQVNGETPPYQRPIKVVKKIAIEGYALDAPDPFQPHGINSNRILRAAPATVAAAPVEGGDAPPADGAPVEGAPVVSPRPARLGGSGAARSGGEAAAAPPPDGGDAPVDGAAPAIKPGDELYEWRYIDQKGFPLSKAQLDTTNKNDLYRMMPFKIQMHIVQASLPKLLEAFKDAPLTMEITQIRINAENNAASQFANLTSNSNTGRESAGSVGGAPGTPTAGLLPGEVVLEIQGTVYLAQPYDDKKLPLPDAVAAEDNAT